MRKIKDMPYHIGFRVKLYPSTQQKRLIAVNDGVKRAVYNHLTACGNERYLLSRTAAFVPADRQRLDYLKSVTTTTQAIKNALPYLHGEAVDHQSIENAVRCYHDAWKKRKERHTGIPVFKKKGPEQSYQTNAHYYKDKNGAVTSNVRFEDDRHVTLPKLGRIRIGASPRLLKGLMGRTADTRIGTVTISRDPVGEYWASFSIGSEEPFREVLPKTGGQKGIDLNLLALANGSDGEVSPNMRFYQNAQTRLAKQQRKLSRMAEHAKREKRRLAGSRNYQEQRVRVAYTHRKIQRQREGYLHNLSRHEIENQDFIAAEDLKVRNLIRNTRLSKSIADAGWRRFLTMLQYKGQLYGKTVVLVPPQNTTQACSICGHVMKGTERLTLSDREWECPKCHTRHDRDTNAARNILKKGLQLMPQSPS